MRVLTANKFAFHRGGLERVMFDEMRWLTEAGHEVALFSSAHPDNEPSPWSGYFAPYLELGQGAELSLAQKATAAGRMFANGAAARSFESILREFNPDVVHAHGIHRQLSPSILRPARTAGIPVVQTLHDYHHICPADVLLYRGVEVCDPRRCGTLWYGACVSGRCVRGSLAASALSAAETGWSRLRRAYESGVSRFISPSAFLAEQMRRGGWKIPVDVVPNAVTVEHQRSGVGSGFVYIGRLAAEKGIEVLLAAAEVAGIEVTVAGEGPLGHRLRMEHPEVRFTGRLGPADVARLVDGARGVVVPSRWYENAPMSVLEAMAAGVPVIASRIGGIPEQITDGVDGLLCPPGDVGALAKALRALDADEALAARIGKAAAETAVARFGSSAHVGALLASYQAAGART